MATISGLLRSAAACLASGPHPQRARADAELLLMHVLERNRAWLLTHGDEVVAEAMNEHYLAFIERRYRGEPIQYITGAAEFYGLSFQVAPGVLIPRPETEHLVERALALAEHLPRPRIVDVGTGSGAIAVALAHQLPAAELTAIDLSPAALEIARNNAARNGVAHSIRFLAGDLLAPVATERFDLVVSNPPYVAGADRSSLSVEVRDHEPEMALFAGEDGLAIYRRLIPAAHAVLVANGSIALEIGMGQAAEIELLLLAAGFDGITFAPDLQGIPRVAYAQRA